MTATIFRPGQLVRDSLHGLNGEVAPNCYLILTHISEAPGERMNRNKYMSPGYYEAISPDGIKVRLPDDIGIWEIVS